MTVEKKEILELQKYISAKIEEEKSAENPDSTRLFDLNLLDSNISLLVLGFYDSDENSEIELGTRDRQIKSALLEFRKTKTLKNKVQSLSFEGSNGALEIIEQINNAKSNLENFCEDDETKILAENFLFRFDQALKILLPVASFSKSSKKNQKLWQTQKIDLIENQTNSLEKNKIPPETDSDKTDSGKSKKTSVQQKKSTTGKNSAVKTQAASSRKSSGEKQGAQK